MSKQINQQTIRTDEEKNIILHRLHRIKGQVSGVENMIEQNRYCNDILIQLSAIDKAIKSLANLIIDRHLHTCVICNIKEGNENVVDEISDLFKKFQ